MSTPPSYQCKKCGEAKPETGFYKKRGKVETSWCRECYRVWYHNRNGGIVDRACDWCGTAMQVTGRRAAEPKVFCSYQCKDANHKQDLKQAVLATKKERPCVHCGATIPVTMRADASFCSDDCNSAAHNVTRKIAKRAAYYRGDDPKRLDDLISKAAIAARDGYRCQLCGGRVAMWRTHPDPLSASIDHIIPLAHHGGNGDHNLQLAHLRCNLSKRAGVKPAVVQPQLCPNL